MEAETISWSECFLELNMRISASSVVEKRRACLFCVPGLRSRSASTPAVDGLVMAACSGSSARDRSKLALSTAFRAQKRPSPSRLSCTGFIDVQPCRVQVDDLDCSMTSAVYDMQKVTLMTHMSCGAHA